MPNAYIGLGANLGNAAQSVRNAIEALGRVGTVRKQSSLYRTTPWGVKDQPDFINAVVEVETSLTPRELLRALKALESALGRTQGTRWGARVIDLDILLYDDLELNEPDLAIPHRHIRERAFVLVPLAEIEPRYAEWLEAIDGDERAGVRKLVTRG